MFQLKSFFVGVIVTLFFFSFAANAQSVFTNSWTWKEDRGHNEPARCWSEPINTPISNGVENSMRSVDFELGGACTLSVYDHSFVPHSGMYRLRLSYCIYDGNPSCGADTPYIDSDPFYIDASLQVDEQNQHITGTGRLIDTSWRTENEMLICLSLADDAGKTYTINQKTCAGSESLQPFPVINSSCTINNNNNLDVSLGQIERSLLPTAPNTGNVKHVQVSVDCTGGVDVPVNMTVNYTPISIGGGQVIQSSTNGLGVSFIYNNALLAPNDETAITFISGSNVLDLGFEAVRDPQVSSADLSTGAFTASAVVIMTQQ